MSGGYRPGAGRKKGTPNKATLARAAVIAEREKRDGKLLFIEIIVELANQFRNLSLAYAPHRERKEGDKFPPDEHKFREYGALALDAAGKGVKFQTPALQSTTLRHDAPAEPIQITVKFV